MHRKHVTATRAAAAGAEAVFNFVSAPDADPFLVSTILAARLPLYPVLRGHASSNFSLELSRHVLTGELDTAPVVVHIPAKRLNSLEVESFPLCAVFKASDRAAFRPAVSLADFADRVWVLYGRHVHPTLHDRVLSLTRDRGVKPRDFHHVTTAEEAAHLITQHADVAFLTRNGAWRITRGGLTMRPLHDPELLVKTPIITRSDDESGLTSEFVRASMRHLQLSVIPIVQQSLPLTE